MFRKIILFNNKNLSKLIKNKKGVSSTVSSILMILIAVAAMSLVISFGMDFINARSAQMSERIVIERTFFTPVDETY